MAPPAFCAVPVKTLQTWFVLNLQVSSKRIHVALHPKHYCMKCGPETQKLSQTILVCLGRIPPWKIFFSTKEDDVHFYKLPKDEFWNYIFNKNSLIWTDLAFMFFRLLTKLSSISESTHIHLLFFFNVENIVKDLK